MSSPLTIKVTNRSPMTQTFFIFQEPAVFAGGGMVNSNSLFAATLLNYDHSGVVLTFMANSQPYAAVQEAFSPPMVGQQSGYASAVRPIDLTTSGTTNNWTTASVSPLGLSPAVPSPGVMPGAFRVTTPNFQPFQTQLNVGSAVETQGQTVLSSFVQGQPMMNIDCAPRPIFYVATGNFAPGTVMNFAAASAQAARCDFSGGAGVANVTYNPDGPWTVLQQ